MKRTFDILISGTALVVSLPVMTLICVAVYLGLGFPIFFVQERTGKQGRLFKMIKFRTMKNAFDRHGNPLPDEKRLTRLGQILRKTSLDELPELINVWRGEMSLVGPRPLLPQYLERYSPRQFRRHEVLPGLTGWAQVNGRNALSWDERFELDVWYVDNRSFWLDLKILFLTVGKVLFPQDISHDGHVTMPEFQGNEDRRIRIIGAGGHAKVVIEAIRACGQEIELIYDDNTATWGTQILGIPVTGPISLLAVATGVPAIIAIGHNGTRQQIAEKLSCRWMNVIHPTAWIAESVRMGCGNFVAAGAIIQSDTVFGDHVIINTAASIDHDCQISSFVHVAPQACLTGNVTVGEHAFVGANSVCIPGVTIGKNCVIGAGTVLIKNCDDQETVVGNPGQIKHKPLFPLTATTQSGQSAA